MSCGACCGGGGAVTDLVFPEGTTELPLDKAPRVRLISGEITFSVVAMLYGSYPVYAFSLRTSPNVKVLKKALATALRLHPAFAGRLSGRGPLEAETDLVYVNAGVPFTVVRSNEASAPEVLEETSVLNFGDVRRNVVSGKVPLFTVKLTTFKDGSAVLALSRSHCIADGTYMWAFVGCLARAARGESLSGEKPVPDRREELRSKCIIANVAEFEDVFEREVGARPTLKPRQDKIMIHLFRAMDFFYRMGLSKGTTRSRVYFSSADLERVKAAAKPSGRGQWVTTQEALTAHILLSLARVIVPPSKSDTKTGLFLMLDMRSALGLHPETPSGMGFIPHYVGIDRILEKSLTDVALSIHEQLMKPTKDEELRERWTYMQSAMYYKYGADFYMNYEIKFKPHGPFDLLLRLNNQSKRELPDFGAECGGKARSALSLAGPSLLFPEEDGASLYLSSESFMDAPPTAKAEALRLIGEIPR